MVKLFARKSCRNSSGSHAETKGTSSKKENSRPKIHIQIWVVVGVIEIGKGLSLN